MSRAFWTKKVKDDDGEFTKVERRKQKQPKTKEVKAKEENQKKEVEFTPEVIQKQLKEILANRGKRGADREAAIDALKVLASKASAAPAVLKVKITLLSALFDLSFNTGTAMKVPLWKDALECLSVIVSMLESNPMLRLCEDDNVEETVFVDDVEPEKPKPSEDGAAEGEAADEGGEDRTADGVIVPRLFQKRKAEKREDGLEFVAGSVYAFAKRLFDEYTLSLQEIDSHSQEYLARLADEITLLRLLAVSQRYYERLEKPKFVALLALLRVESLCTKYDPESDSGFEGKCKIDSISASGDPLALIRGEKTLLHRLCALIYRIGNPRAKIRAVICAVYNYAMHNHFYKARDLLLMSHAQDNIGSSDIETQILYNRCIAQLGVSAFRTGLVRQSLAYLSDLSNSSKIKELLAQGVSSSRWGQERDLEKEKLERRRQRPYHQHISLDLLETIHLISSMLVEVPNLASSVGMDKRHNSSRNFRRIWESHHKNAFNGPPDNARDYIVAAAIHLTSGDWREAYDCLMELKMWSLFPHADAVKKLLHQSVKEAGLSAYLIGHGEKFSSIMSSSLIEKFELKRSEVQSLCSKLIASNHISGAWDQPSDAIIFKDDVPNSLQASALKFAETINVFVEQNERLMEHRHQFGKGDKRGNWSRSGNNNEEGSKGGKENMGKGNKGRGKGGSSSKGSHSKQRYRQGESKSSTGSSKSGSGSSKKWY